MPAVRAERPRQDCAGEKPGMPTRVVRAGGLDWLSPPSLGCPAHRRTAQRGHNTVAEQPQHEPQLPRGTQVPPALWSIAAIGSEFALGVVACTLLGYWVDRHFSTGRRWTLICALLGLVGGFYNLIQQARRWQKAVDAAARVQRESSKGDRRPPDSSD